MLKPYPFQETAIALGSNTNCIIADECGLGKTLEAVEAIKNIFHHESGKRALVVCPKSVKWQWLDLVLGQKLNALILDKIDVTFKDEFFGVNIIHYDMLIDDAVINKLARQFWDVIVLDEAHRIKNRKTKRFKAVKKLQGYRRILLTGTPMDKSAAELWSLLNFIQPEQFKSYWKFESRYVLKEQDWRGYVHITGSKNQEQLAQAIGPYFIRRTKEEVAPQLPEKIFNPVLLEMTPAQRKVYAAVKNTHDIIIPETRLAKLGAEGFNVDALSEITVKNALARLVKLQQVTSHPFLVERGENTVRASTKLDWIDDFLQDNPDEPVIIFTRFREAADIYATQIVADELVIGGSAGRVREGARRIVGTIDAMGESYSFPWIRTAIFVDLHWSTVKMTQAIDRIHRINITEPKQIVILKCLGTVDTLIADAVNLKWSEAQLVFEAFRRKEL